MIIQTDKPLRARAEFDHYPTPLELCRAGLAFLPGQAAEYRILDPGAGTGVWGRAARERWPNAQIYGLELNEKQAVPHLDAYTRYDYGDYLQAKRTPEVYFDMIVGNPPYKLALPFVEKSLELLGDGGLLLFLLRLAFLESQERYQWWKAHPPKQVWICSRRPSFTNNGHTDATAYALYLWEKDYQGQAALDWLMWDYDTPQMALFNMKGITA